MQVKNRLLITFLFFYLTKWMIYSTVIEFFGIKNILEELLDFP